MQNENLRDHGRIAAWTDADNSATQREYLISSRRAVVRSHLGNKFQGKGDEVTESSSSCAAFMVRKSMRFRSLKILVAKSGAGDVAVH